MRDGARAYQPDAMPCAGAWGGCCRTGRVGHVAQPFRKEHRMRSDHKARRGLRAFIAATVISLTLGGALATTASAAVPTNLQRAQRGAPRLANQISDDHGFGTTLCA